MQILSFKLKEKFLTLNESLSKELNADLILVNYSKKKITNYEDQILLMEDLNQCRR